MHPLGLPRKSYDRGIPDDPTALPAGVDINHMELFASILFAMPILATAIRPKLYGIVPLGATGKRIVEHVHCALTSASVPSC